MTSDDSKPLICSLLVIVGLILPLFLLAPIHISGKIVSLEKQFPSDNLENTLLISQNQIFSPKKTIYILVTAYSSSPDETDEDPLITASGTLVRPGVAASNFLPFGTLIKIPSLFGNKVFRIEDRMHPRFSKRIDIWMPSKEKAKNFGVKKVKIEIL